MTRGRPKSEISPCPFCHKQFKRLEHLKRHERTHTQEKPFVCPCGRSFSRQDLLSRHERISHPNGQQIDPAEEGTTLIDAAPMQEAGTGLVTPDHQNNTPSSTNIFDLSVNSSPQLDLNLGAFQDPNLFWDTDAFSFDTLVPAQFLDTDVSLSYIFNQMPYERQQEDHSPLVVPQESQNNTQSRPDGDTSTSQENPYPPLAPQFPTISDRLQENDLDTRADTTDNPWTISTDSYKKILDRMMQLKSTIPDFVPLSRGALVRYLEGYFKGFHSHLPFIHLATFRPENTEIELVLSLAAIGALYRFEHKQGYVLYEAVRSLIDEHIRNYRRDVIEQISSRTKRSGISDFSRFDETLDGYNPTHIQRTQALTILMAMSMWGDQRLLKGSFIIGSQLAQMVRELGINEPDDVSRIDLNWQDWVNHEQRRRTLLAAYIVLNLQSIAFDVTPMILSQEVPIGLPSCESIWKASSLSSWEACRKACGYEYAFGTVLDRLLQGQRVCEEGMISAFSNYILIHGLLQKIYLQQKASTSTSSLSPPPDYIRSMERALKAWQSSWETTRESTLDPCSPKGPLGFNATALLRLAHIRLNLRSGRCSALLSVTHNTPATHIQDIFADTSTSTLTRSPSLDRAVLQCIHALSIPIRVGLSYVARVQTVHWSIQHSICNLECAYLLTRWMQKIAAVIRVEGVSVLREDEKRLLGMINGLVQDTSHIDTQPESLLQEGSGSGSGSGSGPTQTHAQAVRVDRLAVVTMRLWAEVTGGQHVFDIVHKAGAALSRIADVLESEL